jgi:hypothetical protein
MYVCALFLFAFRDLNMTMTVSEAGRKGGVTLLQRRGQAHFAEIGAKGQASTRARYPGMASVWGKMGGRPKKWSLQEIAGEKAE